MSAGDLITAGFRDHPVVARILLAAAALWAAKATDVLGWTWRGIESVLFESVEFNDTGAMTPIVWHLSAKTRGTFLDKRNLNAVYAPIKSIGERRLVFLSESSRSSLLLWYRRRPIYMSPHEQGTPNEPPTLARMRWIRGTVSLKRLLEDVDAAVAPAMREANERRSARIGTGFRVIRCFGALRDRDRGPDSEPKPGYPLPPCSTGDSHLSDVVVALNSRDDGDLQHINYTVDDLGTAVETAPLSEIAVAAETAEAIRRIDFWAERRDWYRKRRIPWRLGALLFGAPGTGKTTLARAVAKHLDIPLYTFDMSSMDNRDFEYAWRESRMAGARMILLEDFDAVFHGRENVADGSTVTFDSVLNMISGIEPEDGLLLVVTANDISRIDPALGKTDAASGKKTRPGRIDIVHEIGPLDAAGRRQIAESILIGEADAIDAVLAAGATDTAAQFTDRCVEAAIAVLRRDEEAATRPSVVKTDQSETPVADRSEKPYNPRVT